MITKADAGISRRHLIVGSTVAGVGALVPSQTWAAQATPSASPATLDPALVLRVSQAVVGGGTLDEAGVPGLADLLSAEAGASDGLAELDAIAEMTPDALAAASDGAKGVAANILSYWFQGQFNGEPVPSRADLWFQFASWQALPYLTQPTLCKAYGYWAEDVMPS